MSIKAMSWAWDQPIDPTAKFILIALSDHANDVDFTCWPSLTHLMAKTGFTRPTIWKTIDRLTETGLIVRTGVHASGATLYRVSVGKQVTLGSNITQVSTLPCLGNVVNRVGNVGNKLGNDVTPNHKNHHEPSINHNKISHATHAPPTDGAVGQEADNVLTDDGSPIPGRRDKCPYGEIVDMYHGILPNHPPIKKLTDKRRASIRARWLGDMDKSLDEFRGYFGAVARSKFLSGKVDPQPGRKRFIADIDFLMRESTCVAMLEGKYANR